MTDATSVAVPLETPGEDSTDGSRWRPLLRRHWSWLVFGAIVVIGTLARYPGLHRKLIDRQGFRQTQTAFTIRELAHHGMHLLHPPLPVLGPPWTVAMEFPLFQAIGALMVRAGLSSDVAGRLLGLLWFEATAVVLFLLVRKIATVRAALIAAVLFQAVPLNAQFGFASLMEYMATAGCLASIYAVWKWFDGGRWWWLVVAGISSGVGFLTKVTTGAAWMAPLAVLAFIVVRTDWRAQWRRVAIGLAAAPGVGLVLTEWWTHYSDAEKAASPATAFLQSNKLWWWNSGPISERLNGGNEQVVLDRITNLMTGPWPLLVAAIVMLALARHNRLMKLSLVLVPLLGTQVFFNLYVHHDYYQCALVPAYVSIMAIGIDEVAQRITWRAALLRPAIAVAGVVAILATTWTSNLGSLVHKNLAMTWNTIPWQSRELLDHTPPGSQILTVGCHDWDSRYLYYAHRRGLMLPALSAQDHEPMPPLTPAIVDANYQYVLSCAGSEYMNVLPIWLKLSHIAPGLYKIIGT